MDEKYKPTRRPDAEIRLMFLQIERCEEGSKEQTRRCQYDRDRINVIQRFNSPWRKPESIFENNRKRCDFLRFMSDQVACVALSVALPLSSFLKHLGSLMHFERARFPADSSNVAGTSARVNGTSVPRNLLICFGGPFARFCLPLPLR